MTATDTVTSTVEECSAAERAIKRASKRVARAQEALEAALVERRRAFVAGREAGLGLRPMGLAAGISPEAVAKAMRSDRS